MVRSRSVQQKPRHDSGRRGGKRKAGSAIPRVPQNDRWRGRLWFQVDHEYMKRRHAELPGVEHSGADRLDVSTRCERTVVFRLITSVPRMLLLIRVNTRSESAVVAAAPPRDA